ncbi:MAG: DUF2207 domain-containing protein [Acidobacteria bacterium]|nr:DUF2207 domain-containing protein [Acidobacteriota bacterium]
MITGVTSGGMRPHARLAGRVAAALLLTMMAAGEASAQRSLVIQEFKADVRVNADGTLDVIETIRPRFTGSWNGIYRTIPVEYRTPQGFNYTLRLDLESATDEAGQPMRHESSRERHYRKVRIWVPGAEDATRTVVLRYRVRNGLKFFDEHDELYWNVTGDEWEVPIETVTAVVQLPDTVTGVRAIAFTGGYGSREQAADIRIASTDVTFRTSRPLNFREGLTVVIGWNPGIVRRPTATDRAVAFLLGNLPLAIPALLLPAMWWLWYSRGRDPRRGAIMAHYEPPSGLSPGEVGTLVDNKPDMRDITATLVDLAVRGYLVIEEVESAKLFGLWSSKDYLLTFRKRGSDLASLKPHEASLMTSLVASASTETPHVLSVRALTEDARTAEQPSVLLSDLQNRFYKHIPGLRNLMYQTLIEQGYYTSRPDQVRTAYLVIGLVASGLVLAAGLAFSLPLGVQPLSAIVAAILTAAIVVGFGWFMPVRTVQGTHALQRVLGFEEFLSRVEGDRFERVVKTPELFEKYLPFAMALGVERTWARAFEGICKQPPDWYRGGTIQNFRPNMLVNDLGRMSTRAASVMASAPRSSGGSGFSSGGGSSGGGFGGGGGGGF